MVCNVHIKSIHEKVGKTFIENPAPILWTVVALVYTVILFRGAVEYLKYKFCSFIIDKVQSGTTYQAVDWFLDYISYKKNMV